MMLSISKAATIVKTDEWPSDQRTPLHHLCVDILAQQINDFTRRQELQHFLWAYSCHIFAIFLEYFSYVLVIILSYCYYCHISVIFLSCSCYIVVDK